MNTLKNKLLLYLADAYCAVWDICRGAYANRSERQEARMKALDQIAISMNKCEGVMVEMEARK